MQFIEDFLYACGLELFGNERSLVIAIRIAMQAMEAAPERQFKLTDIRPAERNIPFVGL